MINLRYDISTSLKDLKRIQEDITQLINEKEKAMIKARYEGWEKSLK